MLLRWMTKRLEETPPSDGGGGSGGGGVSIPSIPASSPTTEGGEQGSSSFNYAELATYEEPLNASEPEPTPPAPPTAAPSAPAPAPAPTPGTETPPAPQPGQPVTQPPTAPAPVQQTAVPPQPAPASTGVPQEQPAAAAQPQPPEMVSFEKHRETFLPKLKELYKLTDQEAELVRTDPVQALPELAARLHYEVQVSLFHSFRQMLPQVIEEVSSQREIQKQADDQFYTRWPQLKKPEYEPVIREAIRAFRATNKTADMATAIERGGLMALLALGLPPEDQRQQTQQIAAPAVPAVVPAAPVQQSASVPRPAGVGGTGHIPTPQRGAAPGSTGSVNIFEDLVMSHERGEI